MKIEKMNLKIRNLEFRTCGEHLLSDNGDHTTAEIVRWFEGEKTCYTVAYWVENSEGFDLKFVNDRPFDTEIYMEDLFAIGKFGQNYLTSMFDLNEYKRD